MSVKVNGWAMCCWRGDALNRNGLIGATTNHTLDMQRDMIEKASSTSAKAREYLPGLMSWSLSVDRMVLLNDTDVSVDDEIADLKTGTVINVCVQIGLDYFLGTAIIERISLNAPLRGKTTAQMELRGTGALAYTTIANNGFDYILPMAFDAALGAENTTE